MIIVIVVIVLLILGVMAINRKRQDEENSTVIVNGEVLGNTQYVAQLIAENTGADIFRIEAKEDYPLEHDVLVDIALEEQNQDARLEIKETVNNMEDYDIVFLGYPNWWGIAAWPVDTFVKANDFNGKTVIPFCTSSSSGLGRSGALLAEEANGGNWQDGQRFRENPSDSDIKDFTDSINQ